MRYGIFGGSFNPVHNGHIIIAYLVLEYLNLDVLYIIPAKNPPHKSGERIVGFSLRYRWLRKVFGNSGRMIVSDLEGRREGKSYTIHTVEHLISKHGEKPFLIIGSDNALSFERWYMYRRLKELSRICVYPRRGFEKQKNGDFEWMDLPLIDISASDVRKRIREGKSIKGYLPESITDEVLEIYLKGRSQV